MRVAFLGPAGTFSEQALLSAPRAAGAERAPQATILEAVSAVAKGGADQAVIPIENSIEGSVAQTLDALAECPDVTIVDEQVLPVSHLLVAARPVQLGAVRRVLSHPQPLGQCARWLRRNCPQAELVPTASTADAVRTVAAGDERWAAIGTARAAELYGATVLATGIEDATGNVTRFVWIARRGTPTHDAAKASVTFSGTGDGVPGWLVRCLSEFAFRGVNLSRIESRPLRGELGHYRFFVDLEAAADDPQAAEAISALGRHCSEVRVLGTYPRAKR